MSDGWRVIPYKANIKRMGRSRGPMGDEGE